MAFGANEGYLNAAPLRPGVHRARDDHDLLRRDPAHVGLINFVVPLQIGARDVAFPYPQLLSFWLTAAGAVLVMVSLFVGEFSTAGWLNYVARRQPTKLARAGPDYYLWALQIAGIGTTLSAINMVPRSSRCARRA